MAIMRSVVAGAAWKTGATVLRWEYRTAAAVLQISAREWYTEHENKVESESTAHPFGCYSVHAIRSDATNQKVLHMEPLHVTAVKSRYVTGPGSGEDRTRETEEYYGDLLIQKSKTAAAALGMVKKQVECVGCPTFESEVNKYESMTVKDEAGNVTWKNGAKPAKKWTVLCQTTDAGSDQLKARDMWAYKVAPVPWILYFELSCFFFTNFT